MKLWTLDGQRNQISEEDLLHSSGFNNIIIVFGRATNWTGRKRDRKKWNTIKFVRVWHAWPVAVFVMAANRTDDVIIGCREVELNYEKKAILVIMSTCMHAGTERFSWSPSQKFVNSLIFFALHIRLVIFLIILSYLYCQPYQIKWTMHSQGSLCTHHSLLIGKNFAGIRNGWKWWSHYGNPEDFKFLQ